MRPAQPGVCARSASISTGRCYEATPATAATQTGDPPTRPRQPTPFLTARILADHLPRRPGPSPPLPGTETASRSVIAALACVDVHCDPNVPPIPPHATLDQMKDTGRAILKGDQDRWGVVKEGVLTKVQEFLPHKED